MNHSQGATGPVASIIDETDQAPHAMQDQGGLEMVAWFARKFHRPYTDASVRARLPEGTDLSRPAGLARALGVIGLKCRLALRDPTSIDPIALPCVVFPRKGPPAVLEAMSAKGRICTLSTPSRETLVREVKAARLRRDIGAEILLVTDADDPADSRLAPDMRRASRARAAHWFWGPVRANWSNWAQILVAALFLNLLSLALPLFVMNVYDKVIPNLAFVTLWTLALGVAIALFLDLLLRTIRAGILENVGRRVDLKVAATLFGQAMNVRLLMRGGGAADIANTIRDFETVREFFASATFVAFVDFLFIGIFVAALFFIVGPIAFVPLLAVPVVIVLALIAQAPISRSAARAQQVATKRHVVLVEALSGIETIKSLNAEPVMQREWENAVAASSRINGRTRLWSNVAANGTMLVQQAVSVGIIVWGVFLVAQGEISIGGLIAANILAGRILAPLGAIAQTLFRAQHASKSLGALNRFMKLPVDYDGTVRGGLRVRQGMVQMQSVSFTYPETRHPALREVSLSVAPGEVVAMLGRVGSGKSTTGKLLAGLLQPDAGTILVDGIASDQYDPAELRSGVGYLPQNPEFFTGTLRENLTIGARSASDDQIMQALYLAGMDAFVTGLPEGLGLFIGERGSRLSGGQRQGLALARLLLRKPRFLFLDEPTSAMDQRMEAAVASRLQETSAAETGILICTHRQSLAALAERLVVMDEGRIVLDGPRDEVLMKMGAVTTTRGGG